MAKLLGPGAAQLRRVSRVGQTSTHTGVSNSEAVAAGRGNPLEFQNLGMEGWVQPCLERSAPNHKDLNFNGV